MFKIYLYFVLVLLFIFLCVLVNRLFTSWRTNFWVKAKGTITESKLLNLGKVNVSSGGGIVLTQRYGASIQYQYQVDGDVFKSNRVGFFEVLKSTSKTSINKVLSRYPVSSLIDVYYNPKEPSEAVLERGLGWKSFFSCICLSIFIVVTICAIILEG